jgi:hypothetical protein
LNQLTNLSVHADVTLTLSEITSSNADTSTK